MFGTKFPEFWAALGAPIDPRYIRTRKVKDKRTGNEYELSYITARVVQNRLDAVAGPENWWATYTPYGHAGVMCCLSIRLPDGEVITKCDVGGHSDMADPGDAEKTGPSDALKRVSVHFGIGRDLYGDGNVMPFLPEIIRRRSSQDGSESQAYGDARHVPADDEPQYEEEPPPPRTYQAPPRSGNGNAPPFGKPVASVLSDDFSTYIRGKAQQANRQLREDADKAGSPPPRYVFSADSLAEMLCWRMVNAGQLETNFFQIDGKTNYDACMTIAGDNYDYDKMSTDKQIQAAIDEQIGKVLAGTGGNAVPARPSTPQPERQASVASESVKDGRDLWKALTNLKKNGVANAMDIAGKFMKMHGINSRYVDLAPQDAEAIWLYVQSQTGTSA